MLRRCCAGGASPPLRRHSAGAGPHRHTVSHKRRAPITAVAFWHWLGWCLHKHRVSHPHQVEDCAKAVAWVKANIASYGGDPHNVVVMGQSAGAHIVGMLAFDPHYLEAVGHRGGITTANGFTGIIMLSPVVAPARWLDTDVLSDAHELARRRHPCACLQSSMVSFLYPAFQQQLRSDDPADFNRCFPLRVAYERGTAGLRALRLPPLLLMTTAGEYDIDTGEVWWCSGAGANQRGLRGPPPIAA